MNLSSIAAWRLLLDDGVLVEDSSVIGVGPSYDRPRCRFEALLVAFLREISDPNYCFLPVPPMLGDGQQVDLYKLFTVAKGKGGYDAVCNGKLWDLVGEESGLGVNAGSSVKLVYSKYLRALEAWVKKVADSKVKVSPKCGLVGHSDEEVVSDAVNRSKSGLSSEGENHDDDDNGVDVSALDTSGGDRESSGLKRKRESMLDLLSWVAGVAKNPCDPAVGSMPEKSKWKSYSSQDVWKQVLLFREAVFQKRGFKPSSEPQSQKIHPCMYDDQLGAIYNLRKRLKHDKKLLSSKITSTLRSSSDMSVGTIGDLDKTPNSHTKDLVEKNLFDSSDAHSNLDRCATICIPVGPNHQAEVPKWTGMTSDSDSKWLGTQIWPLETTRVSSRLLIERSSIGKGRQDSCECSLSGSTKCVGFHIAEKRDKLKLELGVAFYQWNFDKVGEDVRHLWTDEEERKFKHAVQSNPSSSKRYLWDHIFRTFPKKSRADLVNYYFNVFLLQCRGYQNRHTPDNIDSDDDELEYEPLRNGFGHQKQKSRGSILLAPQKAKQRKIASECLSK